MKNYYEILGITKNASKDEIKQAFRKLAIENHPDKGGKKEKFQEIQEAYEILGNEEKRREYDNPSHGMSNFDFFFNNFHQNRGPQIIKKSNHHYNCDISLKDVHFGLTKKIKVKRDKICKECNVKCNECNGIGQISKTLQMGPFIQHISQTCNLCKGSGCTYKQKDCNNTQKCENGKLTEEKIFEIKIPKGIEQHKKFIFEEWGEQAIKDNEISGDLIIIINVKPDNTFKRQQSNLIYETEITLKESIIGKNLQLNIFGEMLNLNSKIFGIINPNKQYIIYGKGLNTEKNGKDERGDLYMIFKIKYPERTLQDDEIKKLQTVFDNINL